MTTTKRTDDGPKAGSTCPIIAQEAERLSGVTSSLARASRQSRSDLSQVWLSLNASQRHLSDERNKRVIPRHLGRMPTFASPLTVAPSHAITPRHAKHRTCRTAHPRKTRLAVCQLSGCELPPHCCFILQREVGTLVPSRVPFLSLKYLPTSTNRLYQPEPNTHLSHSSSLRHAMTSLLPSVHTQTRSSLP